MKIQMSCLAVLFILTCTIGCGSSSTEQEFTENGYPKISGTYVVNSSNCEFAPMGGYFSISQDDADLSISVGSSGESGDSANTSYPQEDQISIPPASSAKSNSPSFSGASITKNGDLTIQISYDSSQYMCSGNYYNQSANLICESDLDQCSFSATKTSSDTGSGGNSDMGGGGSGDLNVGFSYYDDEEIVNTLNDIAEGTWCFIGGYPGLVAIYIDENINISISDPSKIEEQIETEIISYIDTEVEWFEERVIVFKLPDGSYVGINFYIDHTEVNYYSNGFSAGFEKISPSQTNECPGLNGIVTDL